ncbi:hypothetical protein DZC31_09890 [Stenotrophomonas rhizophila]|nr:hypothetical protein DZC31_09890 [Stenotrophomonas rhizophila]
MKTFPWSGYRYGVNYIAIGHLPGRGWKAGYSLGEFWLIVPASSRARPHRIITGLKACTVPVGAGMPAKKQALIHDPIA